MVDRILRGDRATLRLIAASLTIACLVIALTGCGGTPRSGGGQDGLSSLVISPANPVVAIGDTERFAVTGLFSDGRKKDVTSTITWTSTNSDIASVDQSGKAVAKQSGTTVIEAVSGSLSAKVTLTVPAASLMSIAITPPDPSVPTGSSVRLAATGSFTDGTTKDVTGTVTWATSDPAVANLGATGLVTGAGPGAATITATTGEIRGATTLTVAQPILISLTIAPPTAVIAKGQTQQLSVVGGFSDGTTRDVTGKVAWTTAPANVAGVSPTGLVSATSAGNATITASAGSITTSAVITVPTPLLTSLAITPPNPSLIKGGTQQLSVTGSFTDGSTQNITSAVSWIVSPSNVVAVSNSGMVTTLAEGTATITATSGSVSGSGTITISSAALVSIAISPASPSIASGKTQQFTATGTYNDGSTQDITAKVSWSGAVPGVLDLSSTGLAIARGPGTARVTATSGSISGTDTVTVSGAMLVSIGISPANPSITNGKSQQFTASGTYNDGSTQDITSKVTWNGAVPGVLDLSSTGLAIARGVGTARVMAASGSITGSDTVTVSGASLVSIAITPANPSIITGKAQPLTATGTYNDGTTQDITGKVSWSGAVPGVLDLSIVGLVTARGAGTATITAASGSISASDTIKVSDVILMSIAITPANPSIPKGETQQLIATGTYNDGSTLDLSGKVTWGGAMPSVMSLSATGLVTAVSLGTATITAQDGPISGTTSVTVSAAAAVSLDVSPATPSITVGSIQQFRAVETFSDGTKKVVTNSAAWTSTDPDIATVSASGVATGSGAGTATISAAYRSVSGSGSLIVIPVTYLVTEDHQRGGKSSYTYFDQANTPGIDSTLRISNPGTAAEDLCAMVYVFSADQQLTECCGCRVSNNGLRTLSLKNNLTSNPLTRQALTSGTIEVDASDAASNPTCDPALGSPTGSLTTWATHVQAVTEGASSPSGGSTQLAPPTQLAPSSIQTQCQYVQKLGSGHGICTCGTGD